MHRPWTSSPNRWIAFALIGAGAIVLLAIVRSAWVCDDAFITLRTIDNLVQGYGLRWNVAERVQTFTHPLWMLLVAGVYLVTREAYYSVLVVSFLLSGVALGLLATRVAASAAGALLGLTILGLSKAFVDFSTSGLENPLTHLLLVSFVALLPRNGVQRRPQALALVAGLLVLNRMDTLLLVLPALAVALAGSAPRRAVRLALIGFAPFLAWELFALIYFGAPFPNSAYAKLFTGIPRSELLQQGGHYLLNSLRVDPLTLSVVGGAALFALRRREPAQLALVAGTGLYVAYAVWIGGDFMSGRFLAAPLVVSVAVVARWTPDRLLPSLLPFAAVLIVGLWPPTSPLRSGADYAERHRATAADAARITDERAFYYDETGLLLARRRGAMPDHPSAAEGRLARESGAGRVVRGGVGFFGYYAGPEWFIIEKWAVCDPLLARLPVPRGAFWRIGHFARPLPTGYEDSLRSGSNRIDDPRIAALYDDIVLATRAPLFAKGRVGAIWRLGVGGHAAPIDSMPGGP